MKFFSVIAFLLLVVLAVQVEAEYIKMAEYEGRFTLEQVIGDVNANGLWDIFEAAYPGTVIVREYTGFNFNIHYLDYYAVPWGLGDINSNGLPDMVCQSGDQGMGGNGYIHIYEVPYIGAWPTEMIVNLTLPGRKVYHYSRICDLDQDGKNEILMFPNHFGGGGVRIYEWENGVLNLVWEYVGGQCVTNVVGDFNNNGKLEFAFLEFGWKKDGQNDSPIVPIEDLVDEGSRAGGTVKVFECTGDNQYSQVYEYSYPYSVGAGGAGNVLDLDGDGQDEFLFGFSCHDVGYRYLVFRFNEKLGDYEVWFDVGDSTGYFGQVDATAGDFDGDGQDEFVIDVHPWAYVYDYQDGELIEELLVDEEIDVFAFQCQDFNGNKYEDIYTVVFLSGHVNYVHFYEYFPTGTEISPKPIIKPSSLQISPTVGLIFEIKGPDETFEIYDIRGALKARVEPGWYNFDLPTGIYFLRDRTTNQSRKFVILK